MKEIFLGKIGAQDFPNSSICCDPTMHKDNMDPSPSGLQYLVQEKKNKTSMSDYIVQGI